MFNVVLQMSNNVKKSTFLTLEEAELLFDQI